MSLGYHPEIGWCVRCEEDLREGKEVVDREMQALEVEYAMFQITAEVAVERLRDAAEELGNVVLVAGPSTLTDPFPRNAEPIPPPTTDTARSALVDTPMHAGSTGNRPTSRKRPLGRMARRGGGYNTTSRVSRSLLTANTYRSMLTPSAAGRGGGRGLPGRSHYQDSQRDWED
jgi:hypothetical protein